MFVIFAIAASAQAWERESGCLGLGANGINKKINKIKIIIVIPIMIMIKIVPNSHCL